VLGSVSESATGWASESGSGFVFVTDSPTEFEFATKSASMNHSRSESQCY
jgi:hypothetical protein